MDYDYYLENVIVSNISNNFQNPLFNSPFTELLKFRPTDGLFRCIMI